ncbi:hypothetical protein FDK38_004750 [Candidozyma auris]|nr:hypothetical protein FDK38_004750 [[Candida] auris]
MIFKLKIGISSVERCFEYANLRPEEDISRAKLQIEKTWPSKGKITFKNFYGAYGDKARACSREYQPLDRGRREGGVLGRTGAGNNSIILSFFKMLSRIHGEVLVHGVDVEDVELRELRRPFAVIPQDAFVFRGTLRQNIDCLGEHSDEAIWAAVKEANLSRKVDTVDHGLDSEVAEGGRTSREESGSFYVWSEHFCEKQKFL